MDITTDKVRMWCNIYKADFDKKDDDVSAGVVLACNGILKLLTNYEEIEGKKIAQNYGEDL